MEHLSTLFYRLLMHVYTGRIFVNSCLCTVSDYYLIKVHAFKKTLRKVYVKKNLYVNSACIK